MAKKKIVGKNIDSGFQSIEGSISRTEQFLEKYQKQLTIVAAIILIVVALIFAYKKFYVQPQEEEVQEQIYVAQQYFERDSFSLALNGDGDFPGFLAIIDDYGATGAANLAHYYAGVSFYKLGEYENAIDYLSDFTTDDKNLEPIALGCIGDSYVELGNLSKAAEFYEKAADKSVNKLTGPIFLMKLGRVYEEQGDWKNALIAYEKIKKEYAETEEGRVIDKFITRAKFNL